MNVTGEPDVKIQAQEDIHIETFKNTQKTPTYTKIGKPTWKNNNMYRLFHLKKYMFLIYFLTYKLKFVLPNGL